MPLETAESTDDNGVDEQAAPTCEACPHPWESHDAIAKRYCGATTATGNTERGCVCTGKSPKTEQTK